MSINEILNQQSAERDAFGQKLMQALRDNMPWGLKVDLGNGQTAELVPMNGDPTASQPRQMPIYSEAASVPDIVDGKAEPIGKEPWSFTFDWRLTNCDQDHIEVTIKISGGGGGV